MTPRRTTRNSHGFAPARRVRARWIWPAVLGALLGSSGPGAVLASVALLDGGHAHHIALERDAGHSDIVLCHDPVAAARSELPQILTRDCEDDHRVHVARADAQVVRFEGPVSPSGGVSIDAAAALDPSARLPMRDVRTEFDPALDAASRRHRTIVLRV